MNTLKLRVGFVTDTGRARERNEDALALYLPYDGDERIGPLDGLFVVADGMGGHDAGDQASRFVADSVANALTRGQSTPEGEEGVPTGDVIAEWLRRALRRIDRELRKQVKEAGLPNQAGSTATVAAVLGETIHFAHVGDSRAYRMRAGNLEQITKDHSWVADQMRAGLLTPEEAAAHPKRHMLTHCLGIGQAPKVDVESHTIEPGDRFLLSSDGMHGVVPDHVIARVLADEAEPQAAARRLIAMANEAGGPDNITVVVIDAANAPAIAESEGDTAAPGVTSPDSEAVAADSGTTNPAAPAVAAKAAGTAGTAKTAVSPAATGPGDTAAGASAPESDGTGTGDDAVPAARSNFASRAVLVVGVVLIAGATTFGAWHYLGAQPQPNGDTPASPDTAAIPSAASDTMSPAPVVTRDSTAVPATASGAGPDTAAPTSRIPGTEPDTLDPGARS